MSETVKDVAEFLDTARQRWTAAYNADQDDRNDAEDDVAFEAGDQWTEKARKQRKDADRPCLTDNRLPVFVNQVSNDGRQADRAIQATPLDGGTPETAQFYEDRIRHIEYQSDSGIAFDEARRKQIVCGRAFIRLGTRYCQGSTTEQELYIEDIEDQFSVLWDPYSQRYDRGDAGYCFVDSVISKTQHIDRFGKASKLSLAGFFQDGLNPYPDWVNLGDSGDGVRVCEYWIRPGGDQPVSQYIIDAASIQDETRWIGKRIPIFPLWGLQRLVKKKRRTSGLVRPAKDSQRLVNIYVSAIAEKAAEVPKTPYKIPNGGIPAGCEQDWAKLNTNPKSYVLYNQYDSDGRPLNEPARETAEPPIQAYVIGLQHAIDSIKAEMGIFDASIGAESRETSGIAIQRRDRQADNANFHFHGNEARTRKALGEEMLVVIPKVDQGEKTVSVRSFDGETKQVKVNAPYQDKATGKTIHHQLGVGEYAVSVGEGKSYRSQRDEQADRDGQLIQAQPELLWVIGDQYFRELDSPGMDERADRMARFINIKTPGLIQQPNEQGKTPIPPEVIDAIKKRDALIDQLTQELHQLADEVKVGKFKTDSAERLKAMELEFAREQLYAEVLMKQETLGSTEAVERLKQELQIVRDRIAAETAKETQQQPQQQQPPAAPAEPPVQVGPEETPGGAGAAADTGASPDGGSQQ